MKIEKQPIEMKFQLALAVILMLTISPNVFAVENSGFQARITQKGLQYASTTAINALASTIHNTKLPDQNGKAKGVTYSLSGMAVTSFTKPNSRITLMPDAGMKWSISGAGLSVRGSWRYKYKHSWIKISDHGSFRASANGISFSLSMDIGEDSNGRPKIAATHCACSISGVHIKFSGGASWIYNLFSKTIEKKIKDILQSKICSIAVTLVNTNAEKKLQKIPVTLKLDKNFLLNYSLTSKPIFTSDYMETHHKGEIFWNGDKTEAPFEPASIPETKNSSRMVYLWLSDYMANTMSYVAEKHGFLKYNLTAKDLPDGQKSILNTTCSDRKCIGFIIPQIGKKFPNQRVKVDMVATYAPCVHINNGTILVAGTGTVNLYAQKPGRADAFLLTLNVSLEFDVKPSLKNELLYGTVSNPKLKLNVIKSDIGTISSEMLTLMVKLAVDMVVIPKLNAEGSKGFPLPTIPDITFTNSQLVAQNSNLMIATDIIYKPKQENNDFTIHQEPVFQVVP